MGSTMRVVAVGILALQFSLEWRVRQNFEAVDLAQG